MENTVDLLGFYGSDRVIAQSAWTSTSRDLSPEKEERIPKLIEMLWSEGHETPFEKANGIFELNCFTKMVSLFSSITNLFDFKTAF